MTTNEPGLIQRLLDLAEVRPAFTLLFFTTLAVATGLEMWRAFDRLSAFPDPPEIVSLPIAERRIEAGATWLTLKGMTWKCDDARDGAYALRAPEVEGVVVFEPAKKWADCGEMAARNPTGRFDRMEPRRLARIEGWTALSGVPGEKVFTLCEGCGPEQQRAKIHQLTPIFILFAAIAAVFLKRFIAGG